METKNIIVEILQEERKEFEKYFPAIKRKIRINLENKMKEFRRKWEH